MKIKGLITRGELIRVRPGCQVFTWQKYQVFTWQKCRAGLLRVSSLTILVGIKRNEKYAGAKQHSPWSTHFVMDNTRKADLGQLDYSRVNLFVYNYMRKADLGPLGKQSQPTLLTRQLKRQARRITRRINPTPVSLLHIISH